MDRKARTRAAFASFPWCACVCVAVLFSLTYLVFVSVAFVIGAGYRPSDNITALIKYYGGIKVSAADLLSEDVAPCDDFFSHVCDRFKGKFVAVDGAHVKLTSLVKSRQKYMLFDVFASMENSSLIEEQRVHDYFKSVCLNINRRNESAELFFEERKKHVINGSLAEIDLAFRRFVFVYSIKENVMYTNISQKVVRIQYEPIMFTNRTDEYMVSDTNEIYKSIEMYAFLQSYDKEERVFKKGADEINRRIRNVYNVSDQLDGYDDFDAFDTTRMDLASAQRLLKSIDISGTLDKMLGEGPKPDYTKYYYDVVHVELVKIVEDLLPTLEPQAIQDYLDHVLLMELVPYLGPEIEAISQKYTNRKEGVHESRRLSDDSRMLQCADDIDAKFPDVVGRKFVRKYFPKKVKTTVKQIMEDVREQFVHMLQENAWMDDETKTTAIEKAKALKLYSGFLDGLLEANLTEKYESLKYPESRTRYNMDEAIRQFTSRTTFIKLMENGEYPFINVPTKINAVMMQNFNILVIWAAFLQLPQYRSRSSLAEIYGSMGSVAGHEIAHSFDDTGAEFDVSGNRRDWWTNASRTKFEELVECYVEQYGAQTFDGTAVTLDGNNTLGENIADNAGVLAAYRALMAEVAAGKVNATSKDPRMKHLTPQQLFFYGHAAQWCESFSKELALSIKEDDEHSPGKARVNVVLGNMPEFFAAFNCPADAKMRLKKTCKVF